MKGGISETRIEKRIVITGDAALDHDQVSTFPVTSVCGLLLVHPGWSPIPFLEGKDASEPGVSHPVRGPEHTGTKHDVCSSSTAMTCKIVGTSGDQG